jgi:hypothetical protein
LSGNNPAALKHFLAEVGDYRIHRKLFPGVSFSLNACPDCILVALDLFRDYYNGSRFNYEAMWALFQRHSKLSILDLLMNRREIRKYHSFDVVRFLFYRTAHVADQMKNAAKRFSARRDLEARFKAAGITAVPQNIMEAVTIIARLRRLPA